VDAEPGRGIEARNSSDEKRAQLRILGGKRSTDPPRPAQINRSSDMFPKPTLSAFRENLKTKTVDLSREGWWTPTHLGSRGDALRGRGTTIAEDAQGTPTQSLISTGILASVENIAGARQSINSFSKKSGR